MTSRMPSDACPVCGGTDFKTNLSVPWEKVHRIYQMQYGDDVARWVPAAGQMRLLRCLSCDLFFSPGTEEGRPGYYAALSSSPSLGFDYYPHHRAAFDVAVRHIPEAAKVLDVGCGAAWFSDTIPGREYTGLEFNQVGVDAARARGVHVEMESVADHAGRLGPMYDVVCAFEVLEHVADPLGFLQGCCAVLRPGGKLILSVPSADSFYPFVVNELLNLPPHHLTRWTDAALANLKDHIPVSLRSLQATSMRQNGHVLYYLTHLIENAELEYQGIEHGGWLCTDERFSGIRAEAKLTAERLKQAIRSDLQLPRGNTTCAIFEKAQD